MRIANWRARRQLYVRPVVPSTSIGSILGTFEELPVEVCQAVLLISAQSNGGIVGCVPPEPTIPSR